jgi:hypothetical protein
MKDLTPILLKQKRKSNNERLDPNSFRQKEMVLEQIRCQLKNQA